MSLDVVCSSRWQLHPGDYVVVENSVAGTEFTVLYRTPNETEMQQHLQRVKYEGRSVIVFQVRGLL